MLSGCVWTLFFRQSGANKRELAEEHMIKVGFRENSNDNGNYGMEGRMIGFWKIPGSFFCFVLCLFCKGNIASLVWLL